jgi:mRNA export factor
MSTFGAPPAGNPNALTPSDCCVPQPGNDGISCLKWSPTANILVSGNWDGGLRCWQVQEQGGQIQAMPAAQGMITRYFVIQSTSPNSLFQKIISCII